jgi:hypothetical protein
MLDILSVILTGLVHLCLLNFWNRHGSYLSQYFYLACHRIVMDLLWEKGLVCLFWKNLSMQRFHSCNSLESDLLLVLG